MVIAQSSNITSKKGYLALQNNTRRCLFGSSLQYSTKEINGSREDNCRALSCLGMPYFQNMAYLIPKAVANF